MFNANSDVSRMIEVICKPKASSLVLYPAVRAASAQFCRVGNRFLGFQGTVERPLSKVNNARMRLVRLFVQS